MAKNQIPSPIDMRILLIQGIKTYKGDPNPLCIKPNDELLKMENEMLLSMYTFLVQTSLLEKVKDEFK